VGEPVLETSRLILREMSPNDLDFVASMLAHPEVMRFWLRCYSREEAEEWVRQQQDCYARHGHGYWLALEKATLQPGGQAGLLMLEVDGVEEVSLGYISSTALSGAGVSRRRRERPAWFTPSRPSESPA